MLHESTGLFSPFFVFVTGVFVVAGKKSQLEDLVEPVVLGLDCQLWGIEYLSQGKHSLLRIYIDRDDGVTLEDCEKVSRQVSSVLDVEDPITDRYTLEVSSPGMDRPLFTLVQYEKWTGAHVAVHLRVPFEGRRKYHGVIRGVEKQDVVIGIDETEYLLPIDTIEKAHVIPQFD
ncbi:Ribosome maturation factor RimP [invertebrate metagenome]|uniref:Ribosome maturation factor RimP n=1 Tax=invertebrate metagenome TaxID=1711999 RepID=A0A2H9T8W5_9ZZZZ